MAKLAPAVLSTSCFVAWTLVFLGGCQRQDPITTYTVPRTSPPLQPLDARAVKDQWDHILAAIVPQQEKVWFFKLVGKATAIDRQRSAFMEFLSTVKLSESPDDLPAWQLPEGWRREEATTELRLATLVAPDQEGPLEISVSSLPFAGGWDDFLKSNVNRWLGQLGRSALSMQTISKLAQSKPTQSGPATVFELSGVMRKPVRRNPHAGIPGAPPVEGGVKPSKEFTYEIPEGWQPGRLSRPRRAAFLLPGGGAKDEVVVTRFPAAGTQMGEIAPNVKRWAGQVGLSLSDAEVEQRTQSITISGLEGAYVELTSPADTPNPRSIYAAMVERQGFVWFFKMDGKPDLVSRQQAAFRRFLESVRFE
ncbi:MAG: hypothetical protein MI725_16545 [Pirellulales bacterium]|nr:hypothetical protein [Pirellulales bacterium]